MNGFEPDYALYELDYTHEYDCYMMVEGLLN